MRILDEILCEFEEIAGGRERRSIFFVERNDLSADQRSRRSGEGRADARF